MGEVIDRTRAVLDDIYGNGFDTGPPYPFNRFLVSFEGGFYKGYNRTYYNLFKHIQIILKTQVNPI